MATQQISTKFCESCGGQIGADAVVCIHCGVPTAQRQDTTKPVVALVLGFFFPGVGQFFYGRVLLGVLLLVITIITLYFGWILTMPISGAVTANDAFGQRR